MTEKTNQIIKAQFPEFVSRLNQGQAIPKINTLPGCTGQNLCRGKIYGRKTPGSGFSLKISRIKSLESMLRHQ
jgi:hypothetical protein